MVTEYLRGINQAADFEQRPFPLRPARFLRKAATILIQHLPDEVMTAGILPTREMSELNWRIRSPADLAETTWNIFLENLLFVRSEVYLLAGRKTYYHDMYVRDLLWVFGFIPDPELKFQLLRTIGKRQLPSGQIPTAVALLGSAPWCVSDDDSTMDHLIMAGMLARETHGEFTMDKSVAEKALNFVRAHVDEGRYITPSGPRHSWHDAFIFPQTDVIGQNQGLLAVSLMAADALGLPVTTKEIAEAKFRFAQLAGLNGFHPFSARFHDVHDASALYPDYLAMIGFEERLSSDDLIQSTIETLPRSRHGFKILAAAGAKGDYYFDERLFFKKPDGTPVKPGFYQNGGAWPRWTNNVWVTGRLHGVVTLEDYNNEVRAVNNLLILTDWAESIPTGGEFEYKLVPENPRLMANLAIPVEQRVFERLVI